MGGFDFTDDHHDEVNLDIYSNSTEKYKKFLIF